MTWETDRYKFLKGGAAQGFSHNHAGDRKMRLFACCIVTQQEAGFGDTLDLRETKCPRCDASGFNTGWGYWAFACGAEILSDGTRSKSCEPSKVTALKIASEACAGGIDPGWDECPKCGATMDQSCAFETAQPSAYCEKE